MSSLANRDHGAAAFHNKYEVRGVLGRGSFGVVQACTDRKTGTQSFAVKRLALANKDAPSADRELKIISELDHPNINRLHDFFRVQQGGYMLLVLERVLGEDLEGLLKREGCLPEALAAEIFAQCLGAVEYMHKRGVVHRDLHPGNIMLEMPRPALTAQREAPPWRGPGDRRIPRVVLVDMGLARRLGASELAAGGTRHSTNMAAHRTEAAGGAAKALDMDMSASSRRAATRERTELDLSAVGVRGYAAPEVLRMRPLSDEARRRGQVSAPCASHYGMVVDSFSLGMVLRYMLTGVPPLNSVMNYLQKHTPSMFSVAASGLRSLLCRGESSRAVAAGGGEKRTRTFRTPSECTSNARDLLKGLTAADMSDRLTIRAAARHPWLAHTTATRAQSPTPPAQAPPPPAGQEGATGSHLDTPSEQGGQKQATKNPMSEEFTAKTQGE
mmetsp:Transcript_30437/g.68258  ORF Transcript_30437/g.68258 Transcript_30437/m.68258 type:complete len:443 (+) Transcript_30437:105-1433(+)